jgi:hypothetical protein
MHAKFCNYHVPHHLSGLKCITNMDKERKFRVNFSPRDKGKKEVSCLMFYYSLLEYRYILSKKIILFQGGKHTQSKGGILAKACEYLADLR